MRLRVVAAPLFAAARHVTFRPMICYLPEQQSCQQRILDIQKEANDFPSEKRSAPGGMQTGVQEMRQPR